MWIFGLIKTSLMQIFSALLHFFCSKCFGYNSHPSSGASVCTCRRYKKVHVCGDLFPGASSPNDDARKHENKICWCEGGGGIEGILYLWTQNSSKLSAVPCNNKYKRININTLRTGDSDLRFYNTTVQDGWRKSAFLTRAYFPCTIYLIMQYIEPVSEWSCWRMFIETWPHSELNFRYRASSI